MKINWNLSEKELEAVGLDLGIPKEWDNIPLKIEEGKFVPRDPLPVKPFKESQARNPHELVSEVLGVKVDGTGTFDYKGHEFTILGIDEELESYPLDKELTDLLSEIGSKFDQSAVVGDASNGVQVSKDGIECAIYTQVLMEESKIPEQTFTVIAKGISDKAIADRIAREKRGRVIADEDDGDKFMVVSVEESVERDSMNRIASQYSKYCEQKGLDAQSLPRAMGYLEREINLKDPSFLKEYAKKIIAIAIGGEVEETRLSDETRKELNQLYMKLHNLVNQGIQQGRESLQSKIASLEKKALESGVSQEEIDDSKLAEVEDTTKIKVKHPGVLSIPASKNFWQMPLKHYISLAKSKGKGAVMKALMNLERWNKKRAPEITKRARALIDRLKASAQYKAIGATESLDHHDLAERLVLVHHLMKKPKLSEDEEMFVEDTLKIGLTKEQRESIYKEYQSMMKR